MGSQQFCLRWNNHQMNMLNVFDQLLHNGDFVDVTLSCTGGNIKAHKMVLSACSPYFQELFRDNPCKHPIVILKDMKIVELRSIVDFMYKGEINVSQDQLPTLLKTAESLKIKGLAEVSSSGSGSQIEQTVDSSGSSVREVNGSVDQNGTEQSDGKSSPHLRRKRHRPTRKASNEDSANEEPEEKMEKTKDSSKSSLLKSEPLEANEPQIELMGDQFSRYDTGDQEASSNDGNTRISQPDFETSQPSTSGALGTSTDPSCMATLGSPQSRSNLIPWVRSPCRSGPCKTWQEETMFTAVRAVLKMGVPLIHASRRYGIPYPTLFYYTSRVRHLLKPEESSEDSSELHVSGSSCSSRGSRYYPGCSKVSRATGRRGRPTKVYLGSWPDEDLNRAIVRVVYRDYMPEQLESILASPNIFHATSEPPPHDEMRRDLSEECNFPPLPVECNFTEESEDSSAASTKDVGTDVLIPETALEESNELWPNEMQGQNDVGTETEIDLSLPL